MGAKRVLIIDDDPGIRQIVKISLKAIIGWDVLMAASGIEGLEIAILEQPDAILLDVMMPDMDGITTFQHMQANAVLKSIPTIWLTAKSQPNEQDQLTDLPSAGFITKPFKSSELVRQIQDLLNW